MTMNLQTDKPTLNSLPENYLISLDNFSAISLVGEEQTSYLNGQVTCDVTTLAQNQMQFGGHCNAKGKVHSIFRLFNHLGKHLLFQPKSTLAASLAELSKFGVFAEVDIEQTSELKFTAVVGQQCEQVLTKYFGALVSQDSAVIEKDGITLVYIGGTEKRYLLVGDGEQYQGLLNELNAPVYDDSIWSLLEIHDGFPIMQNTEQEFVPQMLNLQAIDGISFTKGCYLGQETVARMKYLGRNKKALYVLTGTSDSISSLKGVEKQLGENWRSAGDIIAYYQADDGTISIQAVLGKDIGSDTNLRVKSQPDISLSILPLPYSLEEE